jgi:phage baseplate assembly protein W
MSGISVKLPLTYDFDDGPYALNKKLVDVIQQNFKMLLLTIPGERIMNTDFGVGIQRYLFENDTIELRSKLSSRIKSQVGKYMSFIKVRDVILPDIQQQNSNFLRISIKYYIEPISMEDVLNITIPNYDGSKIVF